MFFVAPGEWSLWQCGRCRSAWLDPRPNEATIGIAYGRYYTHEEVELPPPRNAFERLRAALGNGYRNRRYGTHLYPASSLGRPLVAILPPLRWRVDVAYRYLPRRPPEINMRVLDIGCGNGAWLKMAREGGWGVGGVEPDPVSREQGRTHGFDVRATITEWLAEPESFDYVTMSHVIEHVHDPLALLRDAYNLLKPGGGIYVDTPNLDALGHGIFGRHWRGLETAPPPGPVQPRQSVGCGLAIWLQGYSVSTASLSVQGNVRAEPKNGGGARSLFRRELSRNLRRFRVWRGACERC